ncbi:unnamed protein product [Camellia sinensis]
MEKTRHQSQTSGPSVLPSSSLVSQLKEALASLSVEEKQVLVGELRIVIDDFSRGQCQTRVEVHKTPSNVGVVTPSIVMVAKTDGHENQNFMARGQFHKEEIFFGPESNANNLVKKCDLKPTMAENYEQSNVHDFEIFDIVQDLSCIRYDLVEMDIIMSTRETSLTEQLLPLKHSFLIHELRSGVRHTNVMLRGAVFRTFSINFFTYGLPVLNKELQKDMDVWETIGLWHYPIPGFFIFAQFCLGILVAMSNLVNSSVFLYLSDGDAQSTNDNCTVEVLFVDTTIPRKFGLGHRAG